MKYVSVAQMIAIEKESDANGHTYPQMMEHAGRGLAETIRDAYSYIDNKKILGLVGSGNNGGDTLVAFCYLQDWGWQTTAWILKPRDESDPLMKRFIESGGAFLEFEGDPDDQKLTAALGEFSLLLDGVFGTGIHLPLRGGIAHILDQIRQILAEMDSPPKVIAVDCPSGIDCDTGEAAPEAIPADLTVTMAAIKEGLLKFPAYKLVGVLHGVGIGLPEGLAAYESVHREVIDRKWVKRVWPTRPLNAHKSTFGVVMVVAGSVQYSGAVLLSGESAFRSGAGWVTLAVPESLHAALAGSFIEATWLPLPHENGWIAQTGADTVLQDLDRVTTMLIGPGFGMQQTTRLFLRDLIHHKGQNFPSLVVDADGLKLLAQIPDWADQLPDHSILTPHPGEMSVLTGLPISEIQSDRVSTAERFAQKWGHVVVLKGAFTVIASPDGQTAIIPVATPALARAGTGDVLAGLITGFRAQGMDAFDAAAAGTWIHAQAGLRAAEMMGSAATVLAGDVLAGVMDLIADLEDAG